MSRGPKCEARFTRALEALRYAVDRRDVTRARTKPLTPAEERAIVAADARVVAAAVEVEREWAALGFVEPAF